MESIVWAVGDAANASRVSVEIGNLILRGRPDKFLYLGDVYSSGLLSEYQTNYEMAFGPLKTITAPIPGNHDWASGSLSGYKTYWESIADYYSFSLAGWHFFCLDSEIPHHPGSPQYKWLFANRKSPAVICCHRPRYSEGPMYRDFKDIQPILDIFAGKTVLLLSGHNHNIQDFHPINGVKQIGVGSGGVQIDRPREHLRLLWSHAGHGALKMQVCPQKIKYQFINPKGEVLFQNFYPAFGPKFS